jgi:SAM-dependent methyltransferase
VSVLAHRLRERYFGGEPHPYRLFESEVTARLRPDATLLDGGCGRTAPVLQTFRGRAKTLIGVDLVDFTADLPGLRLIRGDLGDMAVDSASVDVVMARSVMEHVDDPARVYAEVYRVLKPGGHFVFLTANLWDYASLVATLVPNRMHPWIVARTEGRAEQDVFPVRYRTNTRGAVRRWSRAAGFEVESFRFLGQYPAYFLFNGPLFLLATAYEKTITRFSALGFLRGWILAVLRKPPGAAGIAPGARVAPAPAAASSSQ